MNARPQMTSVEPRIRMPAWRSASPKKRQDLERVEDVANSAAQNLAISPNEEIQSLGDRSHGLPWAT